MTIVLIKIIFFSLIWCLGIKISTSDGMILGRLGDYGQKKVEQGYKIFEALWVCEWCIPSVNSSVGILFCLVSGVIHWDIRILYLYPIIVMGTSFCCGMLWNLWTLMKTRIEYFKNLEQLTFWDIKDRKKEHYDRKK